MVPAMMELHKQPAANTKCQKVMIKVTYISEKSICLNPNIPYESELRVGLHGRLPILGLLIIRQLHQQDAEPGILRSL